MNLFFGGGALVGAMIALAAEAPGLKLLMFGMALTLVALGVGLRGMVESVRGGVAVIDADGPSLRFVALRRVRAMLPISALLGVVTGTAPLVMSMQRMPVGIGGHTGWTFYALGITFLALLIREFLHLFVPAGLTLSETGLSGVRGSRRVRLRWDDLETAEVVSYRGAQLSLRTTAGRFVRVESYWIGSDPNVVAPVIEHYRHHPEDRHLLGDPLAALRRVEEVSAA
jgi:hypothetical protein